MNKILRIAIPTYNRSESLIKQLTFFSNEITSITSSEIDIFVYNNASTDDTKEKLLDYTKLNSWVNCVHNKNNLGLVGNINKILESSEAFYTWVVGDDDDIEPGILKKILKVLDDNTKLKWLFINHNAYDEKTKEIKMISAINKSQKGFYSDGKQAITDIFTFSRTTPMFITACIFNTKTVKEIINNKVDNNLVDPLEYSFYCASKGGVFIFDEIFIHNKWGTTSWSSQVIEVMYKGVFSVLVSLKEYGYTKKQVNLMTKENLKFNLRIHLSRLFRFEILALDLLRFYDFKMLKKVFNITLNKVTKRENDKQK